MGKLNWSSFEQRALLWFGMTYLVAIESQDQSSGVANAVQPAAVPAQPQGKAPAPEKRHESIA